MNKLYHVSKKITVLTDSDSSDDWLDFAIFNPEYPNKDTIEYELTIRGLDETNNRSITLSKLELDCIIKFIKDNES